MGDEKLRELERAFATSGALADERRLLAERLRLGRLASERLALAAYCGSVAARDVLGGPGPDVPSDEALRRVDLTGIAGIFACAGAPFDFADATPYGPCFRWAQGLRDFETKAAVRCAVAGTRRVLSELRHDDAVASVLQLVEAWARRPSTRRANAATDSSRQLLLPSTLRGDQGPATLLQRLVFECARTAARAVVGPSERPDARVATANALAATLALGWRLLAATRTRRRKTLDFQPTTTTAAADASAERDLLAAVRDEVAPWLLGHADPLGPEPAPAAPLVPGRRRTKAKAAGGRKRGAGAGGG